MVYQDWNIHTISFGTYRKHILDTCQWSVHILDMFKFCHAPNHPFCLVKHRLVLGRAPALQLRPMVLCQALATSCPDLTHISTRVNGAYWTTKENRHKFAGPWPKACQIMDPWTPTMSNIFFCRSQPNLDNFQSKNRHRATAAATVAVVVAVVAQIVVSCSKNACARGGCQGASGSSDRHSFLRRVTFFLHLFLGILRLLIFSYFVQNWSPNSSQNGVHF